MKKKIYIGVLIGLIIFSARVNADENLFGYISSTDTLPKGASEAYQWATWRYKKSKGTYSAFDLKSEFEHGLTDKLTGSLYLNFRQHTIEGSAPVDSTTGEAEYQNRKTFLRFQGVQTAFKYNFLSVYKDPIGFSLYLEPGYSRVFKITAETQTEWSIEVKLIFQKNFLDDQLVWSFNATPEFEVRKFEGSEAWEHELALEFTNGVSYRFVPNWYGGLESRYHSEYPEYGPREHYAIFAGPNIHYGAEKWWFTLTVLPQIIGAPHPDENISNKHLSEHERVETRLKVGYNF